MLLFEHDLSFLYQSVERVIKVSPDKRLVFVEIGLNEGKTAEALITKIASIVGDNFTYYGIDPIAYPKLHPRIKFINKTSFKAIDDVPSSIDWLFVDGCHCAQCVIKDFVFFGLKISPLGEICFHDASPSTQGRDPQNYDFMKGFHNEEEAKKGIAVRAVIDISIKKYPLFELVQPSLNQQYGGVEVYRRKVDY